MQFNLPSKKFYIRVFVLFDYMLSTANEHSAVIRDLHHSVVLNRELSRKASLYVFKSLFVPNLIYGNESWVVTERVRSQTQVFEMRFLQKIKCVTMFDKLRNTDAIEESVNIELLLLRIERTQLRWLAM